MYFSLFSTAGTFIIYLGFGAFPPCLSQCADGHFGETQQQQRSCQKQIFRVQACSCLFLRRQHW